MQVHDLMTLGYFVWKLVQDIIWITDTFTLDTLLSTRIQPIRTRGHLNVSVSYAAWKIRNLSSYTSIQEFLPMQWLEIVLWGMHREAVFILEFYLSILCFKKSCLYLQPKSLSMPLQTALSVKTTNLPLSLCGYHVILSKTIRFLRSGLLDSFLNIHICS